MSVYAETTVMEALFARLKALVFSPALPIAWPNVAFTPPDDRKWLRATDIPASTLPANVAASTREHVGIMQVDVFRPLNEGPVTGREIAAQIAAQFAPPLVLYAGAVRISINQAAIGPSLVSGDAMQIPVSIRYRAFL